MTDLWRPEPPHGWLAVSEVRMAIDVGGPGLYYRLDAPVPIRDDARRWREDAQGRNALEAFAALPLADMYARLAASDCSDDARSRAQPGPNGWLSLWPELASLVTTFGPLGLDWARAMVVRNPAGDRARPGRSRTWVALGPTPGDGLGLVRPSDPPRPGSWSERVEQGDTSLPRDFLGLGESGPLWGHQADLRAALRVAQLLGEARVDPHRLRDAVGWLPRYGRYDVRERDRQHVDLIWREAAKTPHGLGSVDWTPFDAHPTHFDWPTAARIMLAEHLTAELAWLRAGVGLDPKHAFRTGWQVRSLLEVIYLQLLEHLEERLHFGVGECDRCGGPVLRTRRSEGTRNKAHRGCAAVLRKRRHRERQRAERGA